MRFSVIIPVYNKGPYVSKAIKSVLEQTFRDFELIVVDDGSSDDSFQQAKVLLDSATVKYQLVHQENAGVSTARNNGVAVSHGEYICFLDADDWWAPNFLERIDWLITAYPDAGIYGTNYYYVKNGKQRVCVTNAESGYINYCQVYADTLLMPLTSISVAIPRVIFEEMNGFNPSLRLGEDFDLWIRIALKYNVSFLNEPLAFYYQDSDPRWRGTGHLIKPTANMLWNLGYLEEYETSNPDYKRLIDRLRIHSLFPYYLSNQYRNLAKQELAKVNWTKQPRRIQRLYNTPIFILLCRRVILKCGSRIKQLYLRHI